MYIILAEDGRFWNGSYWVKEYPDAKVYGAHSWSECRRDAHQASSTQRVTVVRDYGMDDETEVYHA